MMTTKKTLLATLLLVMATSVQAQGLKDAYKNYFKIGVAVNQRNVVDPVQTDLIRSEDARPLSDVALADWQVDV